MLPTKPQQSGNKTSLQSRDQLLLHPYKQVASPFVVGNVDRFGNNYMKMKTRQDELGPGSYNSQSHVQVNGGRFKPEKKQPRHQSTKSYTQLRESHIQIRQIPLVQPTFKIGPTRKVINMSLEADPSTEDVNNSKLTTHTSRLNMKAKQTFNSIIQTKSNSNANTYGRQTKSSKYNQQSPLDTIQRASASQISSMNKKTPQAGGEYLILGPTLLLGQAARVDTNVTDNRQDDASPFVSPSQLNSFTRPDNKRTSPTNSQLDPVYPSNNSIEKDWEPPSTMKRSPDRPLDSRESTDELLRLTIKAIQPSPFEP